MTSWSSRMQYITGSFTVVDTKCTNSHIPGRFEGDKSDHLGQLFITPERKLRS